MTTRKVTFVLPSYIVKDAEGGLLLGDFNNWNTDRGIPLHKNETGDLTVTVELISGESYKYRYLLSDGRWENDDRAHSYELGATQDVDNCVIFVSAASEYETEHMSTEATDIKPTPKKTVKKAPANAKDKIMTGKEDLTKVEGISKQIAGFLQQKGIETFKQLSKTTIMSLKELLEDGGPKFAKLNPSTWPKQAKALIPSLTKSQAADKAKVARVKKETNKNSEN